tara:strand:- start:2841 stop:3209 length:369 start_codon:yes stop_codon:yes gene_type:complete
MAKGWVEAFKTVKQLKSGVLVSIWAVGGFTRIYSTEFLTYPLVGKLFVWKTLGAAQSGGPVYEHEIWECKCLEPKKAKEMCSAMYEEQWSDWWEQKKENLETRRPRAGTLYADAVQLVKRIE